METAKATPLPMPGLITPANAVKPPVAPDQTPPWLLAEATPMPRHKRPRKPSARRGEPLHWSVVALTLFTVVGVLFSAQGASQSQELLPVMIKIPVR